MNKRTLSLLVDNTPGLLSRVSGLFTRRGYNIVSITAGVTTDPAYTRITIVTEGDEDIIEQIVKQLRKLVDVIDIKVLDEKRFLVVGSIDKARPDLYAADEEARKAAQKEKEDDKDYEVFDELPFWHNGAGVVNGSRRRLFLVSLDPLTVTPISGPKEDMGGFTVRGDEVFYAVQERGPKMLLKTFTVKAYDLKTSETQDVMHTDSFMLSHFETVGDRILVFGGEGKRYGLNENDYVYELDTEAGVLKLLFPAEHSLYNSVGSDCRLGGGREAVAIGERHPGRRCRPLPPGPGRYGHPCVHQGRGHGLLRYS